MQVSWPVLYCAFTRTGTSTQPPNTKTPPTHTAVFQYEVGSEPRVVRRLGDSPDPRAARALHEGPSVHEAPPGGSSDSSCSASCATSVRRASSLYLSDDNVLRRSKRSHNSPSMRSTIVISCSASRF